MNSWIVYSLEAATGLALFYAGYWFFLRNETFFKVNRFYLLFSVMLSMSLPLLDISITGSSFIAKHLVSPLESIEGRLFGVVPPPGSAHMPDRGLAPAAGTGPVNAQAVSATLKASSLSTSNQKTSMDWNLISLVAVIYFLVAALLLLRFLVGIGVIAYQVLTQPVQLLNGIKVIHSVKHRSACSFLAWTFLDKERYDSAELKKILSHEKVHVQQRHSLDLILIEVVCMVQWFNPFVWLYARSVRINHEYLADEGTLNGGIDPAAYHFSLLKESLMNNRFSLASSYGMCIKTRIAKMLQKRSPRISLLKLGLVMPVIALFFGAFSLRSDVLSPDAKKAGMPADTALREVSVPIEYLKLLEGEYVSNDEQFRKRTIVFTELLGHLYGFDAGYSYRIIPVGGEHFVNPDDKASLVFDSRDKNAISLLLFGKIHLRKQYRSTGSKASCSRSLAFTVANVMVRDGVDAGMSFYRIARDSANYFLTENDMNFAGYVLLQDHKIPEATALFRLNTQLFSNSFNVYDSYAEALLAAGDKAGAIENYRRSLVLNPGSKSGIEHLSALGVNTDHLVTKVKLDPSYLKLLEGDYLSTNEGTWVRWIRFNVENGVLYGNDNGYRYQLIPMGDGRFVNPDDGASLVFNTKKKNAIALTLFGKVTLEKVPTVREGDVALKAYCGVYLPVMEDKTVKTMIIFESGGKLFRRLESESPGPNQTVELMPVTRNVFFYADNSARSILFNESSTGITSCTVRRRDMSFSLVKQK